MTRKDRLTHDVVHAEKVKRTLLDRDEIALRFMLAAATNASSRGPFDTYAILSYKMADAFLEEREKQSKGGAS